MNATASHVEKVDASLASEEARLGTLPCHFGMNMLTVEARIYHFMAQFASAYDGGLWKFYELSNGGFYMSPPEASYEIAVDSNGYRSRMSADAAGITCCLLAFSHLSFEYTTDTFARHYYLLYYYAKVHPEAWQMLAACD